MNHFFQRTHNYLDLRFKKQERYWNKRFFEQVQRQEVAFVALIEQLRGLIEESSPRVPTSPGRTTATVPVATTDPGPLPGDICGSLSSLDEDPADPGRRNPQGSRAPSPDSEIPQAGPPGLTPIPGTPGQPPKKKPAPRGDTSNLTTLSSLGAFTEYIPFLKEKGGPLSAPRRYGVHPEAKRAIKAGGCGYLEHFVELATELAKEFPNFVPAQHTVWEYQRVLIHHTEGYTPQTGPFPSWIFTSRHLKKVKAYFRAKYSEPPALTPVKKPAPKAATTPAKPARTLGDLLAERVQVLSSKRDTQELSSPSELSDEDEPLSNRLSKKPRTN